MYAWYMYQISREIDQYSLDTTSLRTHMYLGNTCSPAVHQTYGICGA